MHLAVVLFTVFAAWRWGDWRNWKKYHSTMMFIVMGNLLYNFLYANQLLWELKPDIPMNCIAEELIYTFIVLPLAALLFLSNFPEDRLGQILRCLKYIAIFIVVERIFQLYGRIVFNYGWSIWWSLAWDSMMFPMLILHHKKPLIAYAFSLIALVGMLLLFPVNLRLH